MLEDDIFFDGDAADARPDRDVVKEIQQFFAEGEEAGEMVEIADTEAGAFPR